jgi:hypothetical protein
MKAMEKKILQTMIKSQLAHNSCWKQTQTNDESSRATHKSC